MYICILKILWNRYILTRCGKWNSNLWFPITLWAGGTSSNGVCSLSTSRLRPTFHPPPVFFGRYFSPFLFTANLEGFSFPSYPAVFNEIKSWGDLFRHAYKGEVVHDLVFGSYWRGYVFDQDRWFLARIEWSFYVYTVELLSSLRWSVQIKAACGYPCIAACKNHDVLLVYIW